MTRIAPHFLGFLLLSGLAASPARAQMYNAGDACPEPTPGRVFTQEGAAGPALVCNGTTLEIYESVLTGPLRKGIGTASPAAKLDVAGEVKVGNTSLACSGTTEGAQRYNSTKKLMEYCNATCWKPVAKECPCADVTSGLVARWKLDESSGTTAADSSGNSLNGTLTNGPVWQPSGGYYDGALDFDGTNDYVAVSDPGTGSVLDFGANSSITITAWVKMDSAVGCCQTVLAKGGTSAANYILQFEDAAIVLGFHNGGWRSIYSSSAVITPGSWQFVAASITFNSGPYAIYLNGTSIPVTEYNSPLSVSPTQSNIGIQIGNDPNNEPLPGLIDDVRIYNRILTETEIKTIYEYSNSYCR